MSIAVPDYGTHAHSLSLFLWENAWGRMPGALRSYLGYSDVYDVKWLCGLARWEYCFLFKAQPALRWRGWVKIERIAAGIDI